MYANEGVGASASLAGWEPPFIHHMVTPRLRSRHFRNLTTIHKLLASHNSSTWLGASFFVNACVLLGRLFVVAGTRFAKCFPFFFFFFYSFAEKSPKQ